MSSSSTTTDSIVVRSPTESSTASPSATSEGSATSVATVATSDGRDESNARRCSTMSRSAYLRVLMECNGPRDSGSGMVLRQYQTASAVNAMPASTKNKVTINTTSVFPLSETVVVSTVG